MTDSASLSSRILVLGASGYVGNNILRAFSGDGSCEVVVGCRQPSRLGSAAAGRPVRVGDLRDERYRRTVFEGIDVVCFAAAWSALHGRGRESRENFLEPTIAAMSAAADAGVRRVLFTSAMDVKNVQHSVSAAIRDDLPRVWPHLANVMAIEAHLQSLAKRGVASAALRCGYFVGPGCNLGILPVLLPRLRARLVPFIEQGRVALRLVDGRDVGEAFRVMATVPQLAGFHGLDVVGEQAPTFRDLLTLLNVEYGYPLPWFDVSYPTAHRFAAVAELFARLTRREPLLTRSIVFLSEPARVDAMPLRQLGFTARYPWQQSVREQVGEIQRLGIPSRMADTTTPLLGTRDA